MRLRVGEAVGGGVGVLDPAEAAVLTDDDVGVGVQAEEGCDLGDAVLDVATEEHAALAAHGAGDEDVGVAERPGEGEPLEEAAQLDPAAAVVAIARLRFQAALGVGGEREVELLGVGVDDHPFGGVLAEVDAGLLDHER